MWEIELCAPNPREAAQRALEMQHDPESTATVFDVYRLKIDEGRLFTAAEPVRVDLGEYRRGAVSERRKR